MKVYTITCQHAYNYGARLQTYALAHYLHQQGHDVEVIDYRPDYMRGHIDILFWPGFSIRMWGKLILQLPDRIRAKKRQPYFDQFSAKYIPLTKRIYYSIDELRAAAPEADVYICGSDQIWNTQFRNGTDPAYYLDFGASNTKRISYAASFATPDVEDSAREFVQSALGRLDKISVREHSALAILEKLGYQGTEVVDPVFLLSRDEWCKMADHTGEGEKYVLVYDFMNSPTIQKEAERIAHEQKLQIFNIGDRHYRYCDRNYIYAGPETFVALIKNATHVVSNSFHGTAFAMLFGVPYSVLEREDGLNVRMQDLIKINTNELPSCITRSKEWLQKQIA